jgi:hypothetical protein
MEDQMQLPYLHLFLLPTPGQQSTCTNQPQSIDSRTPVMHPNHQIHYIRGGSLSCHRTPSSSSQRLSRFPSAKQAGALFLYFLFSSSKSSHLSRQTAALKTEKKNQHPFSPSSSILWFSIAARNSFQFLSGFIRPAPLF